MLAWEAVERQRQSCCVAVVGTDQLVLGRDRQFRFDHVFNPTVPQVRPITYIYTNICDTICCMCDVCVLDYITTVELICVVIVIAGVG